LASGLLALSLAAQNIPKRPPLEGADTNQAAAYYQYGLSVLQQDPRKAADAFYWAARIDPTWAQPLYAGRIVFLMGADDQFVIGYMDEKRSYTRRDRSGARAAGPRWTGHGAALEGGGRVGRGDRDCVAVGGDAGPLVIGSPALLVLALGAAPAHPLHTTLATVEWHADRHQLAVAVRMFTQDLADAVTRPRTAPAGAGAISDSLACRYAAGMLSIRDAAGRPLRSTSCSTERTADVTWIRLIVPAESPAGLRVLNALLFECFPDQINIVQASLEGRARTILFTAGDGPKPLT